MTYREMPFSEYQQKANALLRKRGITEKDGLPIDPENIIRQEGIEIIPSLQLRLRGFTTKTSTPPNNPTITGPAEGKIKVATDYNFTTTDPDGDDVSSYIEWGDGTNSGWIGPSSSGDTTIQSHTWTKKGTYTIKAKAKDIYGNESDWGQLSVTMPYSYNIPIQWFLERILERFPHVFPILRYVIGY